MAFKRNVITIILYLIPAAPAHYIASQNKATIFRQKWKDAF